MAPSPAAPNFSGRRALFRPAHNPATNANFRKCLYGLESPFLQGLFCVLF
jgi:hypothetical protein